MLELPHVIIGATIAAKIGNPALALPLALASHFALDVLPHWNPHLNSELKKHGRVTVRTSTFVAIDGIGSLVAGFAIASTVLPNINHFVIVILGAFLAVLPDVVEAPHFFLGWHHNLILKLLRFQKSIQTDAPPAIGITSQIVLVAAALWWLFN